MNALFLCFCCRVQRHPFERIATPFQVYSWTAPQVDHAMDCVRAEDAYTSRLGYEEHIPGQVGTADLAVRVAVGIFYSIDVCLHFTPL